MPVPPLGDGGKMIQTSYVNSTGLHSRLPYDGGFCQFWFIPVEHISSWPGIDPLTQWLDGEPVLADGKAWFGPISVPDSQRGFTEEPAAANGGWYYKQKVYGVQPGDAGQNRVNNENLPYHRFAIVGKLRAGGMYLLLGSEDNWFTFSANYKSGKGNAEASGHEFQFSSESLFKAMVMTVFDGDTVEPPPYDSNPIINKMTNQTEIIPFTESESGKTVAWNSGRISMFGLFPEIQVWGYLTGEDPQLITVPIETDEPAPNQTQFVFTLPGTDGFIVLK